jgi:hypothetical protein
VEVKLQAFSTSALDGGERSATSSGRFTPGEGALGIIREKNGREDGNVNCNSKELHENTGHANVIQILVPRNHKECFLGDGCLLGCSAV